ncbi:MAG: barstar family protein [Eubacteriales bacterium]|nr:barstar family protein [Eubacteriales bacterium]
MRKIVLKFPNISSRNAIHEYLKEKLELPEYCGNNLDALYDCLTDLCEPTAVGIFLPVSDNDELDIEAMCYLEKVKRVFLRAEQDNPASLAVFSDEDVWAEEESAGYPEEDPDEVLSRFFESLDPLNQEK